MNSANKLVYRWLGMIAVAILCTVLILVIRDYRLDRKQESKLMTLSEALWVADSNLTAFYGPGTPESARIAEALSKPLGSFNARRFDAFLLWRGDLISPRNPGEALCFEFDPSSIPAENKNLAP